MMKNTVEVLDAVGAVVEVTLKALKDGWQPGSDISQIVLTLATDPKYRDAMQRAGEGITEVPGELKAGTAKDRLELVKAAVDVAIRVMAALEK